MGKSTHGKVRIGNPDLQQHWSETRPLSRAASVPHNTATHHPIQGPLLADKKAGAQSLFFRSRCLALVRGRGRGPLAHWTSSHISVGLPLPWCCSGLVGNHLASDWRATCHLPTTFVPPIRQFAIERSKISTNVQVVQEVQEHFT